MLCRARILSSFAAAKKRKTLVKLTISDRSTTLIPAKKDGITERYSSIEEVERI